jgi:hypothetical protein
MRLLVFCLTILLVVSSISCKKNDDNDNSRQSIILGKWYWKQWTSDINSNGQLDDMLLPIVDSTSMSYEFTSTGDVVVMATDSLGQPVVATTKWELKDNETTLRLYNDTSGVSIPIHSLTTTDLILEMLPKSGSVTSKAWAIFKK